MNNEIIHLHRFVEPFLTVGAHDLDALSPDDCREERNLVLDMDALSCLPLFPNLKKLVLRPGEIKSGTLEHLKGLRIEALKIDYCSDEFDDYTLDLSWFPELELLVSRSSRNFANAKGCPRLQTIIVTDWMEPDLGSLRQSSITALKVLRGKLKTLHGIEDSGLLSLSLSYQRGLSDVSALQSLIGLESLQIDHCPKIDLQTLPELPHLKYLELYGSQTVRDLGFLRNFPQLDRFLFDIRIAGGQLAPLLSLSHSVSLIDRAHYSLKDRELPKASTPFHSDCIPSWLEILPESV